MLNGLTCHQQAKLVCCARLAVGPIRDMRSMRQDGLSRDLTISRPRITNLGLMCALAITRSLSARRDRAAMPAFNGQFCSK
jgi:hypothetical protein